MTNNKDFIFGLHAVIEAIESGRQVDKVFVKKDLSSDLAQELISSCKQYNIPLQRVPIERLNRFTRKNHQGVVALLAAVQYNKLDDLIPLLYEDGLVPLIVVLDGITDVRNFGAIARTCECAGVNAVVIPERNSVTVNADAVKTSAGALNYLPVCRERNIVTAIKTLKNNGYAIIGTSDKNSTPYTQIDFTVPTAIVLGSEDRGVSTDILNLCDNLVRIPEFGEINSLNVSVAGGIMIYEAVRQRINAGFNVN